jgi:hypothetical protein
MSFNNGQLHGFAFAGTLVLGGALFGATLYLTQAAQAAHVPPLKEMVTIEAQLARKSEKKKQPQKELKAPAPVAKPEGVSHDENKKPVEVQARQRRRPAARRQADDRRRSVRWQREGLRADQHRRPVLARVQRRFSPGLGDPRDLEGQRRPGGVLSHRARWQSRRHPVRCAERRRDPR